MGVDTGEIDKWDPSAHKQQGWIVVTCSENSFSPDIFTGQSYWCARESHPGRDGWIPIKERGATEIRLWAGKYSDYIYTEPSSDRIMIDIETEIVRYEERDFPWQWHEIR